MTINCCELSYDFTVPLTEVILNKLKAEKLVKSLNKINEKSNPKRNFMIMPMNVFNILEHHDKFEHLNLLGRKENELYLVGKIYQIECYLDLHMMEDTIILSWDKQSMREMKLETILGDSDNDINQLKIDVIL